jgi:hypothetical protein
MGVAPEAIAEQKMSGYRLKKYLLLAILASSYPAKKNMFLFVLLSR